MDYFINEKWKGIAKGNTAFCILGGPSSNQVKDLDKVINNNFTVTVNHNIKRFPNADLYITGDSMFPSHDRDSFYFLIIFHL